MNEKNADNMEEFPKNESNNEEHLFPFTNDFLIDLPPNMLEKGKLGEKENGENEENEEEDGKRTRVILLPATKGGR